MLRLARELKHQSISKRDDSSEEDQLHVERRRSARLNPKQEQELLHDSGTESDEDELEEIAQSMLVASSLNAKLPALIHNLPTALPHNKLSIKNVEAFLSGSPPALSSSPPVASDIDTESWDSFGHESGILTGEGDLTSDDDECPTPRPRRRMHGGAFSATKFAKEQCEFPFINVCGTAEKRRYSMTEKTESEPIASRLRRNNDSSRDIIVAARRAPVRLLINKPYSSGNSAGASSKATSSNSNSEVPCPAAKRNRCNSWRPHLDLEKMIKNRISNETSRSGASKKDQRAQDN